MYIGAIADDFTGATDLAIALRERGLRTTVVVGEHDIPRDHDAAVVALKSRTAPAGEAVSSSLRALSRLQAAGAERIYVKYCSTFDSTDEGNIGPVLDAVTGRVGVDRTVVVPAFPANGRTVREGRLYVGADLLEDSPMRHHPLTPMTRSRVRDILSPQTRATLTEIPLSVVRRGPAALRAEIDLAPAGYVIPDAVTDADLATIAAATPHLRVISGGAALAAGLPAPATSRASVFPSVGPGRLVVCGSASAATRSQIVHARQNGATAERIDLDAAVTEPTVEIARLSAWVRALPAEALPLVYSVGDATDVRVGESDTSAAVERVLSGLVAAVVGAGDVHRIIVAGGETSGAVVQELGIAALEIGPRLAAGVCWSAGVTASGITVAVALKSGNFGADDLFTTAWKALQ